MSKKPRKRAATPERSFMSGIVTNLVGKCIYEFLRDLLERRWPFAWPE